MTPEQAKQALLDAGFYSEWYGRVLVGGIQTNYSTRLTYKDVESEWVRYEIYIVDQYKVNVLFKTSDVSVLPKHTTSKCVLGESPEGLISVKLQHPYRVDDFGFCLDEAVKIVIDTLSAIRRDPSISHVHPDTTFQLGQHYPNTKSEVEALSELLLGPHAYIRDIKGLVNHSRAVELSFEDRLNYPATEYVHRTDETLDVNAPNVKIFPNAIKVEGHKITRTEPQPGPLRAASVKHHTVFWYPIERLQDPEFKRFRDQNGIIVPKPKPKTLKVEFVASMLTHEHKDGLDRLLFTSREPVDGMVEAVVFYSKIEPPTEEPLPEWLVQILEPRMSSRTTFPTIQVPDPNERSTP